MHIDHEHGRMSDHRIPEPWKRSKEKGNLWRRTDHSVVVVFRIATW